MDDFKRFLAQARRKTYAIPHGQPLGDGMEVMSYNAPGWSYRDRYAGQNPYGGHELVFDHARRLAVALAAPHHDLVQLQRHPNYKHRNVIWAFEMTILRSGRPHRDGHHASVNPGSVR